MEEKRLENTGGKASANTLTACALLAALALIFSYIEYLVPINIGVPGVKIGLANICVVMALYYLGIKEAAVINLIRIALSALLFGNLFSGLYALAGAVLSLTAMALLKRSGRFSLTAVSMTGGALHNFGQIAAAAFMARNIKVFLYYPVLLLFGAVAGIFNGIVCTLVLRKLK